MERLFLMMSILCSNLALFGQTIYYVNDNSTIGDIFCTAVGNNLNNGTSPATPKATLSNVWTTYGPTGTNVLTAGDTIKIDAGTYTTDIFLNINVAGLTFQGAGAGITTFDNLLAGASTNYFMYILANDITLMDMTISGYENNGTQTPGHSGQAITIGGGAPISLILLQNVNFSGNGASGGNPAISVLSNSNVILRGGGSFCNSPGTAFTGGVEVFGDFVNLLIEDYVLALNEKSSFDGGGLRIEGGSNTFVGVRNSRIASNLATNGGGISQINGTLYVQDCIIEDNTAGQVSTTIYGGGVRMVAGAATFSRCIFSTNSNHSGTLRGAAIACRYQSSPGSGAFSTNKVISLTLDSCLFTGNSPATNGRDIYAANGSGNSCVVTARDCRFLTGGNFNIVSDGASPATGITVTYHGTAPTFSGAPVSVLPSANPAFTPNPTPPSYLGTCGSVVLPSASETGFHAECLNGIPEVRWESAAHSGVEEYLLSRSWAGQPFEEVDRMHVESAERMEYKWHESSSVPEGTLYALYRKFQDGKVELVRVAGVPGACATASSMQVYSAGDHISISTSESISGTGKFTLWDMQGKLLVDQTVEFHSGGNHWDLAVPNTLPKGVLMLKLATDHKVFVQRFVN